MRGLLFMFSDLLKISPGSQALFYRLLSIGPLITKSRVVAIHKLGLGY